MNGQTGAPQVTTEGQKTGAGEGTGTTETTVETKVAPAEGAGASTAGAKGAGVLEVTAEKTDAEKGKATETGKDGQGKPIAAGADAPLEIKLPEGVKVDKALLDKAMPVFKELKLDSAQASKLATFHAETLKEAAQKQEEAWGQQHDAWSKELKEDKEFGGKNYDVSVVLAQKFLRSFGPEGDALSADLKRLGISNLPSLARVFAKAGKANADDSSTVATTTKEAPVTRNDKLKSFYTDMGPRQTQ